MISEVQHKYYPEVEENDTITCELCLYNGTRIIAVGKNAEKLNKIAKQGEYINISITRIEHDEF